MRNPLLHSLSLLAVTALTAFSAGCAQPDESAPTGSVALAVTDSFTVDATTRYQTFHGFGVDAQPENWGTAGGQFAPTVDALVNDARMSFFRVEIYDGESNWEATNDDASPSTYNWSYYDGLYATDPRFQRFVAYVRHLNLDLGVTDIEIAAHGLAPTWMAGSHSGLAGACVTSESGCTGVPANAADEWAEEIVSFTEWAHNRLSPPLQFRYLAPFNETDLCTTEGICLGSDSAAVVSLLSRVVVRMNAFPDLAGIQLIAPEASQPGDDFRTQILANSTVAPRIAALAYHQYSNSSSADAWDTASPPEYMTEFNGFSSGLCGSPAWSPNGQTHADLLLNGLQGGASAALVWADVDAWHAHQDNFQTFGLYLTSFASATPPVADGARCGMSFPSPGQLDGAVYTARSQYYVTKQFSRFVQPGARRVDITTGSTSAVAFLNPDDSIVVAGRNTAASSETVSLAIHGAPATQLASLRLDYTNGTSNFVQDPTTYPLTVNAGTVSSGSITIPADSVFTLVTHSPAPTVVFTSPGASPATTTGTITLTATATPVAPATVTRVVFSANGVAIPGCTVTASPWTCAWTPAHGAYAVTASATDSTGLVGTSDVTRVWAQAAAPTVTVTSPAAGTLANPAVTFGSTATAASGLSVRSVTYYDGGALACIAYAPGPGNTWPCAYTFTTAGSHTLTARAMDTANNTGAASAGVVVTLTQALLLGDNAIEATDDASSAGTIDSYQYTVGATGGAVDKLCVYVPSTSAATTLALGLYSDSSGAPGSLLASATATGVTHSAWNCANVGTRYTVAAGTSYWLAVLSPGTASTARVTTATGTNCWSTSTFGALPSTFANRCGPGRASLYAGSSTGGVTAPSVTTPTASPAAPYTAGAVLTFSATVTAGTNPVASVAYRNGAATLCTATSAPWSCAWTSVAGTYSVSALASDTASPANTGASPGTLAITVNGTMTAPAAVTDLAVNSTTDTTASLGWTVPTGAPTAYDLRYSTSAITAANFAAATRVASPPTPLASGAHQSFTVTGLLASTTYFFALESSNAAGTSAISNDPSGTTSATPTVLLGITGTTGASADSSSAGTIDSYQYTATASGTLNVLEVYAAASNTATTLAVGLYSDSAGRPGSRLASSTIATVHAGAWNAATLGTGVAITSGTKYWIAVLSPSGNAETLETNGSLGTSTNCWSGAVTSLPASFGTPAGCANGQASLYGSR